MDLTLGSRKKNEKSNISKKLKITLFFVVFVSYKTNSFFFMFNIILVRNLMKQKKLNFSLEYIKDKNVAFVLCATREIYCIVSVTFFLSL